MTSAKQRAVGLDGLRGLAALGVFACHIWMYRPGGRPARDGLLDFAAFELRVSLVLFFVLSGYLLYRQFARAAIRRESVDLGDYLRRRAARILPAYYVAMLGAVALLWGATSTPGVRLPDPSELPLFAVFAQNYSAGAIMRLNPVTWTLGIEVAFYALLPLIGLVAHKLCRRRPARQAWLLAGLIVIGIGWNAATYAFGWGIIAGKALPGYLSYFALGMLLALWIEQRAAAGLEQRPRLGTRATFALVAGGVAAVALNGLWHAGSDAPGDDPLMQSLTDLPAAIGFAALIAAVLVGCGRSIAWTRMRALAAVGVFSYGFYLWHLPLILFTGRLGLMPESFSAALALTLPPALALGAASWFLIERPMIARAARPRSPAVEPPARLDSALVRSRLPAPFERSAA